MDKSLEGSRQNPLLEPAAVKKQTPSYFDTNFFDSYLFFWVNKFVNVPSCRFFHI